MIKSPQITTPSVAQQHNVIVNLIKLRAGAANNGPTLHPADSLVAFLDDLYVVMAGDRACESRDTAVGTVERNRGIASNIGKNASRQPQ